MWEVFSIHLPIKSKLAPCEGGNKEFIYSRNSLFPSITSQRTVSPSFCDANTPTGRQKSISSQKWDSYMHKNERKMFCNRHDLCQLEIASKIMTRVSVLRALLAVFMLFRFCIHSGSIWCEWPISGFTCERWKRQKINAVSPFLANRCKGKQTRIAHTFHA